jgi:CHASE3 domain sensor protein
MSSLQKFNETLEEFDKEVDKLKIASETYQKIEGITSTYENIVKEFKDNTETLKNCHSLQDKQFENVKKNLNTLSVNNREEFKAFSKLLVEKSVQIYKLEKTHHDATIKTLSSLTKEFEEKIYQIRKENNEFYKEIESTIKIKLDENRSQIKQIIENERNQIKQIFEIEFAKNTKELKAVISIESNKQIQILTNNQKTIKISLWIIGGLTIILSALAVIKLWMYQ